MKESVTILALMAGAIGVIGMIESLTTFSLFQTLMSAGLIWGAVSFYEDAIKSLEDEKTD